MSNTSLRRSRVWHRVGAAIAAPAALALLLTGCGGGNGSGSTDTDSTVRIGYDPSTPSLANDIAKEAVTEMGRKAKMVPMEFGALIPSLQSGRIDAAAGGLTINPERCQSVKFSEPTYYWQGALAVKRGNPLNLKTLEDVAQNSEAKLAIPAGSDIGKLATAAGVSKSQMTNYQDISTALDAVKGGRADVVSWDDVTFSVMLAKPAYADLEVTPPTPATFEDGVDRPYAVGIAFPKDSTLADEYSKKQAQLFEEGTKVLELAKKQDYPEHSVPKPEDDFTTSDYCSHDVV